MRLDATWLGRPGLVAVVRALDGQAFPVGGAVRNTLLGLPVGDIDLATPLPPDEVTQRLEKAGLRAVPTGIDHGTVTAVAQGEPYEITTFRADVETDGRRALVRYSDRIEEDAARRDFTINALYARPDGTLIDPLGGLADLAARRVRFIGAPEARIREDYLRILRFFRFSAVLADGIDPEGLAACTALADGIDGLARERIGAEMRKLLAAPDPAPAVAAMAGAGVLARVLPGARPDLLLPLVRTEALAGPPDPALGLEHPDWRARLAALGGDDPAAALRLSRAEQRFLASVKALRARPRPPAAAALDGVAEARAAILLDAAAAETPPPEDLDSRLVRGRDAVMPLAADDLVAAGMRPGPQMGEALARARAAWLASDLFLDKAALLREALD